MTKKDVVQGYETEIRYQKHMIENLGRWFTLLFMIASIGVILICLYHQDSSILLILGIILTILGILGMLIFGYGIHKGRQNVGKVIDDFELKLQSTQK